MSVGSEDSSNAGVEVRWQTCCHLMVWLTPAPQLAGWMLAPEVPRLKTQHRRCRFLSVLMLKARGPWGWMRSAVLAVEGSNIWESMRE